MALTGDAPSPLPVPSLTDVINDLPGYILRAIKARSEQLIEEADTMTLGRVRRLIEKDLNLEDNFLNAHKDLVKDSIDKAMNEPEPESPKKRKPEKPDPEPEPEPEPEPADNDDDKLETAVIDRQPTKRLKKKVASEAVKDEPEPEPEPADNDDDKLETAVIDRQPTKRLKKKFASEAVKDEMTVDPVDDAGISSMEEEDTKVQEDDNVSAEKEAEKEEEDIEGLIQEAACKRASEFKSQAESFTLSRVRRVLEEDLKLEKGGLDAHKHFITKVLDEILNEEEEEEEEPVAVSTPKKRKSAAVEPKKVRVNTKSKESKKLSKKQKTEQVEDEDDMSSEDHGKAHRKTSTKKKKAVPKDEEEEDASEDHGDAEEDSGADEDRRSKKANKPKKVVESKPAYGRKVENLKSIIKACGMTVPPNIYKKVKQASEDQREGVLLKELESILKREGLSAGASKDEIKAVKKRKEKLKDLEGIDTSNIIVESRGRRAASAASFFAPKRVEPVDLSEDEEEEEQESDSEEDPNVDPEEEEEDDD